MSTKKFLLAKLGESVLGDCSYKEEDLHFVEATPWAQDHKSQSREVIFKHGSDYYQVPDYRQGNPFSGWECMNYLYDVDGEGMVECDKVKKLGSEWVSIEGAKRKLLESRQTIDDGPINKNTIWTNNKTGDDYVVCYMEIHSETLEPMVSYTDREGIRWTRPYELFLAKFSLSANNNPQGCDFYY